MILVFDTETTGKANLNLPIQDESQPRLVQLGAILMDDKHRVMGELNVIIKPDGWTIPKEASDIHGITQEFAEAFGVDLYLVVALFTSFITRAHVLVAHNFQFDALIINSEWWRMSNEMAFTDDQVKFCTMNATTDVCKLPGKYGSYKWPKLQEAHQHLFGEQFEGAHDAMADVRACARVYRRLMETAKPEATT